MNILNFILKWKPNLVGVETFCVSLSKRGCSLFFGLFKQINKTRVQSDLFTEIFLFKNFINCMCNLNWNIAERRFYVFQVLKCRHEICTQIHKSTFFLFFSPYVWSCDWLSNSLVDNCFSKPLKNWLLNVIVKINVWSLFLEFFPLFSLVSLL